MESRLHEADSQEVRKLRKANPQAESNLDPWKGDRIPEVSTEASKDFSRCLSTSDHTRRPEDVNREIKKFNVTLDNITGSTSSIGEAMNRYLSLGQQEEYKKYVIDISRRFEKSSREAIKRKYTFHNRGEREEAFGELEKVNRDFKKWCEHLLALEKRWPVIAKIQKYQDSLSKREQDEIGNKLEVIDDKINNMNNTSVIGELTWKDVDSGLKEIQIDVCEKYFRSIDEREQSCRGWLNSQPRELRGFRDVYRDLDETYDYIRSKINRGNLDNMQEDIEMYDNQVCELERRALGVLKYSGRSRQYNDLNAMRSRAEEANEAAIDVIDRNNNLPEATKREFGIVSSALHKEAYLSIMHALRACGSREEHEAFIKAEEQVFQVEMNMLEHSSPDEKKELVRLENDAEEKTKQTIGIINRKRLPASEKQASEGLYRRAHVSIVEAVRACGLRKDPELIDGALKEARIDLFRIKMNELKHKSPQNSDLCTKVSGLLARVDGLKNQIIPIIGRDNALSEEQKKTSKKYYSVSYHDACGAIVNFVRDYRQPRASELAKQTALTEAKYKVLQFEVDTLKYLLPQSHQELFGLTSRACKMARNANEIIDNLPAERKQEVRNASDTAYNLIARAMAVYGRRREDRQLRHEAFINAKRQIFRAELKILMHSSPWNYRRLCDLLDTTSRIARDTNNIIDSLPEATRREASDASSALYREAYASIEFAAGFCGPQEASEQEKQGALTMADEKVRQMQEQMNRVRT